MPQNYQKPVGSRIHFWLYKIREQLFSGALPEKKRKKLEALGNAWTGWLASAEQQRYSLSFDTGLPYAKAFAAQYGHLRVPKNYTADDGYPLGRWVLAMRDAKEKRHHQSLTDSQVAALESLGMYWSRLDEIWDENYLLARQYYERYGDINIPKRYENGSKLRHWLCINRDQAAAGTIKPYRLEKLKTFGDAWVKWTTQ